MSKLRIARSAVADLDEIWLYIAQKQSVKLPNGWSTSSRVSVLCLPLRPVSAAAVLNSDLKFGTFPYGTFEFIIGKRSGA